MQIISGQYCLIRTDKSSNLFCKWHTSVSNTDGKRESSKGTRTRQLSLFHKRKWQVVDGRFRLMNQLIVFWAGRRSDHRPLQTLAGVGCWHGNRRCWSTCDWPARSCSSVGSHAWHAPLVEFPAACHIQVYVCWHTSVCVVWHQTTCRASASYWPLFLAVLCYVQLTQINCWYHGPARPALDRVPSVLLVWLPGMTCRLICATWT